MGELVLITGCSSGIGLLAALECADAGHRVVATLRDLERRAPLEKAAAERGLRLDVEQLDVVSPHVAAKLRELVLKYGPFFAAVNNAGVAVGAAFEEQSEIDVRAQFETNVFGPMAVTRALLPSMRAAGRGRFVNVSCMAGRFGAPGFSVHAASKHAVEGLSESLRGELEPFGIDVCLVEPGTFRTQLYAGGRRAVRGGPVSPYAGLVDPIVGRAIQDAQAAPPAEAVGKAIARLVGASSPPFRTVVGAEARAIVALRSVIPDRLISTSVRRFMRTSRGRP